MKCLLQQDIEDITESAVEHGGCATEVYHFLEALHRVSLWPLSKRLQSSPLQEVLKDLRRFTECRGTTDCGCQSEFFDEHLEDAANDVEAELKGLCLTCFKEGKATREEGNCLSGKSKFLTTGIN